MKTSIKQKQIQTAADIGMEIRRQRKLGGLTLSEAAGLTNVGVRFLSELENGKPTVRFDKLLHVLHALGLNLHLSSPTDSNPSKRQQ